MAFRFMLRLWALPVALACLAGPALAQTAPKDAETKPPKQYGAWSIVCDRPSGAAVNQCALMQNVIAEDRSDVGLSVVVLKTADRKARILRVLAPLGVLLNPFQPTDGGLGLIVDGKDLGKTQFVRCFSDGCYAEVALTDDLLKIMRAGSTAVFWIRDQPKSDKKDERIGIPVELKGFAQGYDALP